MSVAVVIPVKSFTIAKARLAGTLSDSERESLARDCAHLVVRAGAAHTVYVVCESDDIAEWTRSVDAISVRARGTGLNEAVHDGVHAALADGHDHVVIAHGDLPLARSFDHLIAADTVTIVPDRHRNGTNVIAFPAALAFATSYGPDSFTAHVATATGLGHKVVVVDDDDLSLDLDTADDLDELRRRSAELREVSHGGAS